MSQWYYVEGSDRVGPVEIETLEELILQSSLNEDSYVWKKGFPNWAKIRDVEELSSLTQKNQSMNMNEDSTGEIQIENVFTEVKTERRQNAEQFQNYEKEIVSEEIEPRRIIFENLSSLDKEFFIKVGGDRNDSVEIEYGPYCLDELRKMFFEGRINEKTFIALTDSEKWITLSEFELLEKITDKKCIRQNLTTNDPVFLRMNIEGDTVEGIMRDLSFGGGQFLTKEILPLQNKMKGNLVWGKRKAVGVYLTVTRRLEDHSGYVVRFSSDSANLRALIENVFQLE